jgi:hypothetical protein
MQFRGSGVSATNKCLVCLPGLMLFFGVFLGVWGYSTDSNATNSRTLKLVQMNNAPEPEILEEDGDKTPATNDKETAKDNSAIPKPDIDGEEETFPQIMRDLSKLPFPVRRMRELILEAAYSGDIEKLRPLIGYGDDVTMLSLGGIEEDPLTFLKSLSGDKDGHEILAILVEVLESGFVLMDEGSESELYIWPYFFAWPLDKLGPRQMVELYQLVTYGDYEDMESFGAYIFYRLGITPRGRWRFFVAGD